MINKFEGRYRYLSNFYPCKIEYQGITYPSTEHFYVAMKVNDEQLISGKYYTSADFREMIASIDSPGKIKRIGREIKLRSDWETKKFEVMNWCVRYKFKKNEDLKELLLSTGDQELIEGNHWHDVIWGVCTCSKCPKGQNNLGKILMEVREEIRLTI